MKPLLLIPITLLLIACGGSDGDNSENTPDNQNVNPPTTVDTRNLTGTVAVGAPVEALLTITDRLGETFVTESDANGVYSVTLEGRPGPYLIRIEPNDEALPVMYSFATTSGVANATPFTTLALLLVFREDLNLETAFDDWAEVVSDWDRSVLEDFLAIINANFAEQLENFGIIPELFDLFTTPFVADSTGIDAFLDEFTASMDLSDNTYTVTDSNDNEVDINLDIDTTGFYIGARFTPDEMASWELTLSRTIDDGETEITVISPVGGDSVPWRREQLFDEDFWSTYDNLTSANCENQANIECDITLNVSRFDSTFDVEGDGAIGTVVSGTIDVEWSLTGWVKMDGIQQNIDESGRWSTNWRWERKN